MNHTINDIEYVYINTMVLIYFSLYILRIIKNIDKVDGQAFETCRPLIIGLKSLTLHFIDVFMQRIV